MIERHSDWPNPRLTCHLHVGMHKTGTTAIQQTLAGAMPDEVRYLPVHQPNFSGWFATLFEDAPWQHISNWLEGRSRGDVEQRRLMLRAKLSKSLDKIAADETASSIFISGERMSAAKDSTAIRRMKDFLAQWCADFRIYGYVRAPVSFMESSFLQSLNSRAEPVLDPARLWPNYQERLAKFDAVFGHSSVNLAPYDTASFPDGNVVLDLAQRMNISAPSLAPFSLKIRHNPSLRLEGAALLFALRRSDAASNRTQKGVGLAMTLAKVLQPIGTRQLRFDRVLCTDILEHRASDLQWMEARLGKLLPETVAGEGIRSEGHLLEIAADSRPLLRQLEAQSWLGEQDARLTPQSILTMVEEGLRR